MERNAKAAIMYGEGIMAATPQKDAGTSKPALYELEDLWKKADEGAKSGRRMTFEEMNEAKARRRW